MILINALAAVGALAAAPFVLLWTWRRTWMPAITIAGVIFVLLPVQADQDVFWSSGASIALEMQQMYSRAAGDLNSLLDCTSPLREAWERVAALMQAVLIVTADDLGYEVPRGVPLTPELYCEFTSTAVHFATRFVALVKVAVYLFVEIIGRVISFISDISGLSFGELLVELLRVVFGDLVGEHCFDSWYNAWFCICRGRWDSVGDVPTDPLELFAECLNPSYSGGDPIWEGLSVVFGLQPFKDLRDAAMAGYNGLLAAVTRISELGTYITVATETLSGLVSELTSAFSQVGTDIGDIWDDVEDFFGFSNSNMALYREYFGSVRLRAVDEMAVVRGMLELGDFPRAVGRGQPVSRAGALAYTRNVSRVVTAALFAELPGAWARSLAGVNMSAAEADMWGRFIGVAHGAFLAPRPKPAHELAAEMRAANVSFARFAPPARQCVNRTREILWQREQFRDMPRFELTEYIGFETLCGAAVMLVVTVAAIALYPPAMAGVLVVLGGVVLSYALVFVSGNALHMMTAVATGRFDQAFGLQTALYMANYAGRAYLQGGLLNFDAAQFVPGLAEQLRLDAVYGLQLAADVPVCSGLITPFCLPPPVRGEDPLRRIVDALACQQGASCTATHTVADCAGRAKACVAGACQCWLYLPEFRLPSLTVVYNQPLDCTPYGYTNDGIIPKQTGGRLSWTNIWNNLRNTWAAARDLLRQMAHDRVPYWILAVLGVSFLPIVGSTAAATVSYAVAALAAQRLLVWGNGELGWIDPPASGFSCLLSAAPSWGAGAFGIVAVARVGMTLWATGAIAALFWTWVGAMALAARFCTAGLRLGQPYARWWNTRA